METGNSELSQVGVGLAHSLPSYSQIGANFENQEQFKIPGTQQNVAPVLKSMQFEIQEAQYRSRPCKIWKHIQIIITTWMKVCTKVTVDG